MRPGRAHDTTAPCVHAEALPLLAEWTDGAHVVLADLVADRATRASAPR